MPRKPPFALPEPLRGREIGTFAHHTVTVRLPDIARRTISENQFGEEINTRLQILIDEILGGRIRDLHDEHAPDIAAWQGYIEPYRGETWLDVPWFFAEHYFFRRILEATGYYSPGKFRGYDPYTYQKEKGLESSRDAARILCQKTIGWTEPSGQPREAVISHLAELFKADLWGNQADLSVFPAGIKDSPRHSAEEAESHLLVDDSIPAAEYLLGTGGSERVDFLIDNAGLELIGDLCLAYFLMQTGHANVRFHLKVHPTYVSDVTEKDVHTTIEVLSGISEEARRIAGFLHRCIDENRLELTTNFFWTAPLAIWEMPHPLETELGQAILVISKGDAHYRRLHGDLHWEYTTPFSQIVSGFPTALLALRAMKSELVSGLRQEQIEQAFRKDPKWMYDGMWGVIQFYEG